MRSLFLMMRSLFFVMRWLFLVMCWLFAPTHTGHRADHEQVHAVRDESVERLLHLSRGRHIDASLACRNLGHGAVDLRAGKLLFTVQMPFSKRAVRFLSKWSFGACLGLLVFKGDACICGHPHRPLLDNPPASTAPSATGSVAPVPTPPG